MGCGLSIRFCGARRGSGRWLAVLTSLPVPLGRNCQQIYRMPPGFSPPSNSHSIPSNPSKALEFHVNGTSDDQNSTRVGGVSTYNILLAEAVEIGLLVAGRPL